MLYCMCQTNLIIALDRYIFVRDSYTFFGHTIKRIHLIKMRLPFDGIYSYLRISSFGDNLEFAFLVC